MRSDCVSLVIFLAIIQAAVVVGGTERMKSDLLCSQCKKCDTDKCPPSDAYPHMTAFDDSLIAGALQSDYVKYEDRGVYSVPNIIGGVSTNNNSYFGWESSSGSASGYHRFRNYMVKCSDESYLSVDRHGTVKLRALKKLSNLSDADLGVADCEFDGANAFQLFAFRFHYHKAFLHERESSRTSVDRLQESKTSID